MPGTAVRARAAREYRGRRNGWTASRLEICAAWPVGRKSKKNCQDVYKRQTVAQMEVRVQQELIRENLIREDDGQVYEPEVRNFLERQKAYRYPYEYLAGIPAKMTVSELKKAGADEPGLQLYAEPDIIPYIPQFMKQVREEAEGAARGTIYHLSLIHI